MVTSSCYTIDNTNYPVMTLRVTFFSEPNNSQFPSTCQIADNIASVLKSQLFAMSNYKYVIIIERSQMNLVAKIIETSSWHLKFLGLKL